MSYPVRFFIARNEFFKVASHPMVILVGIILLSLTYINGVGGYEDLHNIALKRNCDGFIKQYEQIWYITNYICGIMAAFIGITAVSEERSKGSMNLLITKPLYRRDVIIGKFFGLSAFMFLFIVIAMLANAVIMLQFYGAPESFMEFLVRITSYVFILLLDLSLVMGLMMLVGVVFRDILLAMSIAVTYLSFEWFWNSTTSIIESMIGFPIAPYMLTSKIIDPYKNFNDLFNTSMPYLQWLTAAFPYIIIMLLLVVIILLIDCFAYSRIEEP